MLSKLKIIGATISRTDSPQNPLNLNLQIKSGSVIILDFNMNETECCFVGLDVMQFDQSKNEKILLKSASGQKKSEFPSYQIGVNKDSAQQRENIRKSLEKITFTLKNASQINPKLHLMAETFNNILPNLIDTIFEKIDSNQSNICTVRINGELPGESCYFKPVIDDLFQDLNRDYYIKYGVTSTGKNNVCYICGNQSPVTYGFCSTYNFYSANEVAYIAGGFQREDSWKNYPVCPTCATHLRTGKEWIQAHFQRYFYGNTYLMIPAPTLERDDFLPMLNELQQNFTDLSFRQKSEKNIQRSLEMEDEVFDTLAAQKDQATFTFLFFKESNSEFKILQEAEDILPSRFRKIIDAKKTVQNYNKYPEFKNLLGLYQKKTPDNLSFNFGIIKTFFNSKFNNDFLDIITKILKNRPIDRQFLMHQISNIISEKFRQNQLFYEIPKALMFLKFLYALNLINNQQNKLEVKMDNKFEDYFRTHPEFYDADWKKAVFLTGVLAQNVLDIQWQERNATPFRDRLNGLKIDCHTIKRLLPECINKLEQYKKNYYRELEEIIAILLESGEPDLRTQSVDEISFYFAMGMNRNKQFKSKEDEKEGAENE
jgi:CRISPR-associated protein Csh1